MREILPIWQQMLSTETLLRFGFSQGPTIPFLIGVYHFHGQLSDDDLNSKICLQKVFTEILDTGDGKVGITICTNLGVEIIRKIIFQSQNPITHENVSTHIDNIWETYGKYITTQRFSCDKEDNCWRKFIHKEISNIEKIKK